MDLPASYRQTLAAMPDLGFGEDRADYSRKIVEWARERGISSTEALRCAHIKWDAWEVERLIISIEECDDMALRRAVIRLLKDRYLP